MTPDEIKAWLRDINNLSTILPETIQLESLMAEGGQGIVYKGVMSNNAVAIKVYFPGQLTKRIDREIAALQTLRCPSIVSLHWSGSVTVDGSDLPVVVTSFVEGTTLSEWLASNTLTHDEIGVVAFDIACAIDEMWTQKIVHRDIKTGNVLRRSSGRMCVIDLGLARHVEMSALTILGTTWGTLGYLSPEQAQGQHQLTCKSDVFALGVLLVECAMRRHPTRRDQLLLFALKLHETLPLEILNWKYADLLKDMLHPRPTKRPMPSVIAKSLSEFAPR